MTPAAGSAGTAGAGFRAPKAEPKHRAPPTVPTPRAPTVIAVAAAVLTAASLVAIADTAVAPDATARSQVSTVTRAQRTDAGPLVLPTVGVVAPAVESLYPTPSAPPHRTAAVSRGTRTSQTAPKTLSGPLVATTTPPQQTVTPTTPAVTAAETTPTAPPVEIAAATTSSATTTEEQPVTPTAEPSATVDVTAEVGGP